jgi:hypothetical protein
MRSILASLLLLLPIGCRNAADERYFAQFREDGIAACMRGEGLMRPHWAVPPDRIELSCNCIVTAYMEGKPRRTLQHLTVEDQLRARDRCSGGAPEGVGPGDVIDSGDAVNAAIDAAAEVPSEQVNASGAKK